MDYTPTEAARRVLGGMIDPPESLGAWLDQIRAQLDAVATTTVDTPMSGAARCGTGVPLDQLAPGDRQAVEEFRRYLAGDMGDEERAGYEQGRPAGGELDGEAQR